MADGSEDRKATVDRMADGAEVRGSREEAQKEDEWIGGLVNENWLAAKRHKIQKGEGDGKISQIDPIELKEGRMRGVMDGGLDGRLHTLLDWQPIVKVEAYRLRQDSVTRPVELKEEPPPYGVQ